MASSYPVIVVTGANSGVGFGICHRLLLQLSQKNPPDAQPRFRSGSHANITPGDAPETYDGLTLIMACRSTQRAEIARRKLYDLLDAHVKRQQRRVDYDGHAEKFRENLRIEIHYLDLGIMHTVFRFANEISQKYPYISHLICNAGVASFTSIEWIGAVKQICAGPIQAVTTPNYHLQRKGELSVDGLGWIWQCNVFGHYSLFRTLQPLLLASPSTLRARVVWTSSCAAYPGFYDSDDWQLIKTEHSYESTKYQIDLIGTQLDCRAQSDAAQPAPIRHFVTQPGCVSTNIQKALVGFVMDMLKNLIFYMVRLLGSPHHTISPFKSAIAAVHVTLVSLSFLPSPFSAPPANGSKKQNICQPVRFGSETGPFGDERVGITNVQEWEGHEAESSDLVDKCEDLYQKFLKVEKGS